MAAAQPGPAMAAHGVNFINKNDARAVALGLIKQVAHAAGAHAHKHFHKFRAGNAEKGHSRLAGDSFGQQRFAAAGRANHQHAFGNPRPQRDELFRLPQKFNHFGQFLFGFFRAGHVLKSHRRFIAGEHPGLAFAKTHSLIV
ncbi:MAG: hypothetical protein FOGNACKC_05767 [Anaerolineae bacterium]|nr:hypothetical protein [Anaerolineae bacterium]